MDKFKTADKLSDIYYELDEVLSLLDTIKGYYFSYPKIDVSNCKLEGSAKRLCTQYPVYTNILYVINKIIYTNKKDLKSIINTMESSL